MAGADEVQDNAAKGRFELTVGHETAYADYQRDDGTIVVRYVYAPPVLRGTGASDRLMSGIVAHARAEGRKILPLCGYAASWLRAHRAHHDVLLTR